MIYISDKFLKVCPCKLENEDVISGVVKLGQLKEYFLISEDSTIRCLCCGHKGKYKNFVCKNIINCKKCQEVKPPKIEKTLDISKKSIFHE